MKNEDKAWVDYRNKFADIYDESNYSGFLQSFVMHSSHRFLEKHFNENQSFNRTLEIGAGTGQHISYVRHKFDTYVLSDLDAKTLQVAKDRLGDGHGNKLMFDLQNGEKLNFADNSFDRLIAAHVLEHIYKPHLVLKEWKRVVDHGGVISLLLPTDPGIAWRLGRHLGPRKNAVSQGIAYDYVMAREHVNSCNNLVALVRHYFPERIEAWWPFRIPSIDINLFFICHAIVSKKG